MPRLVFFRDLIQNKHPRLAFHVRPPPPPPLGLSLSSVLNMTSLMLSIECKCFVFLQYQLVVSHLAHGWL